MLAANASLFSSSIRFSRYYCYYHMATTGALFSTYPSPIVMIDDNLLQSNNVTQMQL